MTAKAPIARAARNELRSEWKRRLTPWQRFVLRHSRLMPRFARMRAIDAASRAWSDAEAGLPRRYRRALRGDLMLPARKRA